MNFMFPLDPNAPKRKNKINFWSIVEKLLTIVSIVIAVISLLYSSISFNLSKKAYESSINQFEQNSISADMQFKQIRELLKSYQQISDSSLLVTNNLLLTTRQLLAQQIGSFKPNVGILNTEYVLSENEKNKKLAILVTITNTGSRTAYNVLTNFVYFDKQIVKIHEFTSKSLDLIPHTPKTILEELEIPKKAQIEYYLLVNIKYYDNISNKNYQVLSVFKPSKFAATFEEVEPKIKTEILRKFKSERK